MNTTTEQCQLKKKPSYQKAHTQTPPTKSHNTKYKSQNHKSTPQQYTHHTTHKNKTTSS